MVLYQGFDRATPIADVPTAPGAFGIGDIRRPGDDVTVVTLGYAGQSSESGFGDLTQRVSQSWKLT